MAKPRAGVLGVRTVRGMPTRSPQRNTACRDSAEPSSNIGASGLFNGVRHRIADYDMFADVLAL